jgi:hypothetical protein
MKSSSLLVSTSDIAELANERLAVVSTWRNRYKDGVNAFPTPIGGTPARPLFDFEAVNEWVTINRPEKNLRERLLPIAIWAEIRELGAAGFDLLELVCALHGLLAQRWAELTGGSDAPSSLGLYPNRDERTRARMDDAVRALLLDASSADLVDISDVTLGRLSASYGRSGGDIGAVGSPISRILARPALAQAVSGEGEAVIYDPAVGIAESLIRAAGWYAAAGRSPRVYGVERDPRVAEIARVRLLLRGVASEVASTDSLSTRPFEELEADLVLAEPPLGAPWTGIWLDDSRAKFGVPPLKNADLTWVIDAVTRLRAGGMGLVLTSVAALSRRGAEERIRASLIRAGAVETVIALPPNLLQYSSAALALWVLRAPAEEGTHPTVHVIDASEPDLSDQAGTTRAQWLEEHIADWVISPGSVDPVSGATTAVVHYDELLEAGMDLTPTRWVSEVAALDIRHRLFEAEAFFSHEMRNFKPEVPDFDALPSAANIVTLREMTEVPESREAKMWTGRGTSNDDAPDDMITSREIASGALRSPLTLSDEPGFRTEPGDIVFTTMHRVRALVDMQGGHRLGNGVHALRLEEGSRFLPDYLATCLAARWNERHQKGSTVKHAKPGDLEIPLLSIEAQRSWLDAFAKVDAIRLGAESLVESAVAMEVAAYDALRYGRQEE